MKDLFPSTKNIHKNKELFVYMGVLLLQITPLFATLATLIDLLVQHCISCK